MRRPKIVTLLAALVFILGLLQLTRAATLFIRRDFLAQYNLPISLPYAVGSAAVWGGLLVIAAGGLWHLKRWGWRLALGVVTASQAHIWLDRFLFERSDYSRLTLGFWLGATALLLGLTWIGLWRQRKVFD